MEPLPLHFKQYKTPLVECININRKRKETWLPCSIGKGVEEIKNAKEVSFFPSVITEKVSRWLVQVTSVRKK